MCSRRRARGVRGPDSGIGRSARTAAGRAATETTGCRCCGPGDVRMLEFRGARRAGSPGCWCCAVRERWAARVAGGELPASREESCGDQARGLVTTAVKSSGFRLVGVASRRSEPGRPGRRTEPGHQNSRGSEQGGAEPRGTRTAGNQNRRGSNSGESERRRIERRWIERRRIRAAGDRTAVDQNPGGSERRRIRTVGDRHPARTSPARELVRDAPDRAGYGTAACRRVPA